MTDARQVTDAFVTDVGKVATALGLFASAIKSGENWTTTCEQANREAHDALRRLAARAPVQAADEEADALRADVTVLLEQIDHLVEMSDTDLDEEDQAIRAQIRAALLPLRQYADKEE